MLATDIERFIRRRFRAADREAALALCSTATIHDGSPASPRLIRCALISCDGSLESLRSEIEHLKIDYRDVILSGEYVAKDGEFIQVRDLNQPIEDDA